MNNYLKNINIPTKLYGGFGIVVLLLVIVGATASFVISAGSDDFKRYRAIALQTNQAGRVQANLLEARLAVKNFIINGSDQNIATVKDRASRTLELARQFSSMVVDPEKAGTLSEMVGQLENYLAAFEEVTELQARRNDLVFDTLDTVGPQIERKLTDIMQSAYDDSDAVAAFRAGTVQRSLLLMRLYATKFLVNNDEDSYQRVIAESAEMKANHAEMLNELQNPTRRQLADEVVALHEVYEQAFSDVNRTIKTRNDIIDNTLDTIGPKVASDIEALKLGIKAEQDTLGPRAQADAERGTIITILASLFGMCLGVAAAWLISTLLSRPILAITSAMKQLADGDKTVDIPGQDHGDEIGDMAGAVNVFKDNMARAEELADKEEAERKARQEQEARLAAEETERQTQRAREAEERAERARQIEELTASFDASVSELLTAMASSSTEMEATASSMAGIADGTSQRASNVATAAERASSSVQTVAAATEELSCAISEIDRQVADSAKIAQEAVSQADVTNKQIDGLSEAAQKIGEVVNLISDIAEQTNLLALNATIESARAGEAGKGFAVVASEVKSLAGQTAKATDEIAGHIQKIQLETEHSVKAIESIGRVIDDINQNSTAIASSVEQQGAATREIAQNVQEVSLSTQDVTENIEQVTMAVAETHTAAGQVTGVAGDLNVKSDGLQREVERFLQAVRAA